MDDFRNPTHLLRIGRDPALDRLLRACGVAEAYISGGASDLDKLLALAGILPLCPENQQANRVHLTLREATGISAPLCSHTALAIWKAWVDRYWYEREFTPPDLPSECPLCSHREPTVLEESELSPLPDPLTVRGENLGDWTRAWESVLDQRRAHPTFTLPATYTFRRPDPYHAGEVIRKLANNTPVTPDEESLLISQALRAWGQWHLRGKDGKKSPLLLKNGSPEAVRALLDYLQASRALAPLVWLPADPVQAEPLCGLYGLVGTGLDLTSCESPEQRESRARTYRRVAPWVRATVVVNNQK